MEPVMFCSEPGCIRPRTIDRKYCNRHAWIHNVLGPQLTDIFNIGRIEIIRDGADMVFLKIYKKKRFWEFKEKLMDTFFAPDYKVLNDLLSDVHFYIYKRMEETREWSRLRNTVAEQKEAIIL